MKIPFFLLTLSFLLSVAIELLTILFCKKFKWYDQINERKIHKGNIPRLGSIGFVLSFSICIVLYFAYNVVDSINLYIPLIVSGFIIFAFGIIDDFCVLPAKAKLVAQIVATTILLLGNYRFTCIGPHRLTVIGSYAITFCWFLSMINSFNLIDGVDALCGGIATIILGFLAYLFVRQDFVLTVICLILVTSLLGFLLFNKPKAKIFMGDGGSQFLGFIIAALPLCKPTLSFEPNKLFVCIMIASIPLIDMIAAIWRRLREHRSCFAPDRSHLHHKLMFMGFSVKSILVLLYTLQGIICSAVVIATKMNNVKTFFVLAVSFCFVIVFFGIIHYSNRALRIAATKKQDNQELQ